jgi:ABC-type polysaccharide/polyol phosphate transport system ATPase subunit
MPAALILDSVSLYRPSLGMRKSMGKGERVSVLDSVSISIGYGERVAILGRNGAGKTTLLRVLAGIFKPHQGNALVHEDTAAILDAGFGIEPWLSGRDNAVSRLIVSGIPKVEQKSIIDSLEGFLQIGPYFDEPTRTYSSGMLARLIFGLGTLRQHTALIVDEGFGTVDEQFERRAWTRLEGVIGGNTTVVMASHNLEQLQTHCTRGIVLERGQIVTDEDIDSAIKTYLSQP